MVTELKKCICTVSATTITQHKEHTSSSWYGPIELFRLSSCFSCSRHVRVFSSDAAQTPDPASNTILQINNFFIKLYSSSTHAPTRARTHPHARANTQAQIHNKHSTHAQYARRIYMQPHTHTLYHALALALAPTITHLHSHFTQANI